MISGLKLLLVTLGLCCFSNISKAQTDTLREEVNYLSEAPNIDGELDDHLTFIKDRDFPVKYKSNDENPDVKVTYRLAYGTNFFYVYVEVDAQKLVYRDRAYQNGDGFHMVLAKPTANNQPADEFYVLACSAVDRKNMEWSRNILWYYNVEDIFKPTSKDTKLMFLEKEGKLLLNFSFRGKMFIHTIRGFLKELDLTSHLSRLLGRRGGTSINCSKMNWVQKTAIENI